MSRTARIARALTIGYGYQAVVAVTGLALTPFLLTRLGDADFGRWLIAGQILALLGLLDLGVTAVLPREVARASGSADGSVAEVVRRAWWLVWLQTPFVALVAVGVWVGVSAGWPDLALPLAVVLSAFVVQFPFRLAGAVLNGLQDLTFCAGITAVGWALTTALSVGLVLADWGLLSLAVGWAAGQLLVCTAAGWRLRLKFPAARAAHGWPGRAALGRQFRASIWVSLSQLAQAMIVGTDLLIIAWLLGPQAVVVFSCTTKLHGFFLNMCYQISMMAQPALSQLRGEGNLPRFLSSCRVTGSLLLTAGGAVSILLTAVNGVFVERWVGADLYAGPALTSVVLAGMLVRQMGFVWWSPAYILGSERGLAFARIADGLITLATTVLGTFLFGLVGAAGGSLVGAAIGFFATGLWVLSRELGVSWRSLLDWVTSWGIRLLAAVLPVLLFSTFPASRTIGWSASVAGVGLLAYFLLIYTWASTPPLREYRNRLATAVSRAFRSRSDSQKL